MSRPKLILWTSILLAVAGSAIAWSDWVSSHDPTFLLLALALQLMPGIAIASFGASDRRLLIALVAATVPVIGPIAGLFIESVRGQGGNELLADLAPARRRIKGTELAQRLTGTLAPCDALISGDVEARRATLTHLSRRAASEDIAILRWARNQRDAEVAVEAGLALADLEQRFDERLRATRTAVAAQATYDTHMALVRTICDGVVSGIVDPPLVAKLAAEARRHFLEGSVRDPERARELVLPYGRLELAARRPDLALSLAKRALSKSNDPDLILFYAEAAYAARRFDLVPGLRSRETDARAA